jgi:hypothetical protein
MSTIGGRRARYAVCEGTSQAAPHVTALAAILMELAPTKTPAEIAELIRVAGVPHPDGAVAPRVDALEAVLKAQPEALILLADLNNDGIVDEDDLATYRRHREAMTTVFMSTLGSYFLDLNDNGEIEDNEHWWPRIDLNGSGLANLRPGDDTPRCLGGQPASDLDVIRKAWRGDERATFETAMKSLGLEMKDETTAPPVETSEDNGNVMRRLSASRHPDRPETANQCTW